MKNVLNSVAHVLVKLLTKTGQVNCGLLSSSEVLLNTLTSHHSSIEDDTGLSRDLDNQAATYPVSTVPAVLMDAYQVIAEIVGPL